MSDVATKTSDGTVANPEDYEQLRAMLRRINVKAVEFTGASQEFVFGILNAIVTAETEEDIFAQQKSSLIAGKDFVNRPFRVMSHDISWQKSSYTNEKALPFFAILKVTEIATGEEFTIGCGGSSFVAVLETLEHRDLIASYDAQGGRPLVIMSQPSPAGAVLFLYPFRVPTDDSTKKRGK